MTTEQDANTPTQPPRTFRWVRTLVYGLLALFITLALVLSWALGSESGRKQVLNFAVQQVNDAGLGLYLQVEGVKSPALAEWYFARLSVSKNQKQWIYAEKLHVKAQLKPLLQKHVLINQIRSERFDFIHQVSATNAEPEPAEAPSDGPVSFDWQLELQELRISELRLSLPQIKAIPRYSVEGRIAAFTPSSPLDIAFNAHSLSKQQPKMSLSLESHLVDKTTIALNAQLKESVAAPSSNQTQGFVGALMGLPTTQGLDFHFDGAILLHADKLGFDINRLSQQLNGIDLHVSGKTEVAKNFSYAEVSELNITTDQNTHTLNAKWWTQEQDQFVTGRIQLDAFPLAIAQPWVAALNNGTITSQTMFDTKLPKDIQTGESALDIQPLLASIITPSLNINTSTQLDYQLSAQLAQAKTALPVKAQFDLTANNQVVQWTQLNMEANSENARVAIQTKGKLDVRQKLVQLNINVDAIDEQSLTEILHQANQPLPENLRLNVADTRVSINGSYLNNFEELNIALQSGAHGAYQEQPFRVVLDALGNTQNVKLNSVNVQVADATINARGHLDITGSNNDLTAEANNITVLLLKHFGVSVPEELNGAFKAAATIKGQLTNPSVSAQASGALTYPLLMLDGSLQPQPIQLALNAQWADKILNVDTLNLTLSDEPDAKPLLNLQGQANLASSLPQMNWDVSADNLPAALIAPYGWPDAKGILNLQLHAKAPAADEFNFAWLASLDFDGQGNYTTQFKQIENRKKNGQARIQNIDWQFLFKNESELKKNSGSEGNHWKIESNIVRSLQSDEHITTEQPKTSQTDWINLTVNTQSLFESMTQSGQLPSMNFSSQLDLTALSFLLERDHRLEGKFKADLQLEGSHSSPNINGSITLKNGLYENSTQGVYFEDITLDALAKGQKLLLSQLVLEDQRNGKITAKGEVDWLSPYADEAVQLAITAKDMNIIDRKEIEGQINGNLKLDGNFEALLLSGKLNISPLNVSIAGNPGPSIPEIEYSFAKDELETKPKKSAMPVLTLDLSIGTDQQAFIRGRGLEAELSGNIELDGPTDNIQYQGAFKTVRGHFDIFGKRFKLERGEVGFSNSVATLFISGVYRKKDTEIRAEVTALGDKYELKLSSIPTLPEEEILALIIFGKKQQQISAIQAVQLASAVKTLQGGSGGFDPIGSTRDLLGVDTLTIDSDDTATDDKTTSGGNKGVKVGAGKYITEDVYLEIERSSNPTYPWLANLLIELTPSISLQSTTGGASGETAELMWKRDY